MNELFARRKQMDQDALPAPPGIKTEATRIAGLPAEWLMPADAGDSVILFFHGSGFSKGSLVSHRELAGRIALASHARALAVDYRLTPEHPFPAAHNDAMAAYRALIRDVAPRKLVLVGDSAGGNLVLSTLMTARDEGLPLAAAGVLMSPWTDLTISGESFTTRLHLDPRISRDLVLQSAKLYLGSADPKGPSASPLFGDFVGLPPLLFQVGSDETLFDDTARAAEKARHANVDTTLEIYDGMKHVFQLRASVEAKGVEAIEKIGAFIRRHTGASG